MAETGLWDAKVPTRNRFTTRSITWDSDFPSDKITDQLFFKTSGEVGFYRWDGLQWVSQLFDEDAATSNILVFG